MLEFNAYCFSPPTGTPEYPSKVIVREEAFANEGEGVAHHPLAVPSSLANGNIAEEEQVIHRGGCYIFL